METARDSQILVLQPFADSVRQSSSGSGRLRRLINEIIFEEDGPQQEQNEEEDGLAPSTSYIPWHISNKYYDADVTFRVSNVCLFDAGFQKRPKRTPRAARMVTDSEASADNGASLDDDKELKRRVRNVFEALEKPGGSFKPKDNKIELDEEKRAALSEQVQGIDAVMMVVDPSQPLRQHQHLLAMLNSSNGDAPLLSGFDLAVSIVVALSLPLEEASTSSDQHPTTEQLSDLYTGEGWEFVDLDEQPGQSHLLLDEEEEGGEGKPLSEEELHGIPRIREALQTHTWPDLIRKNDRAVKNRSSANDAFEEISNQDGNSSSEAELERALALLQVDLGSMNERGEAEPTKQDEELAEAFLKRVLASQAAQPLRDQSLNSPSRSLAQMQAELRAFLDEEPSDNKEAWTVDGAVTPSSTAPAFDDDFSDFVQGPQRTFPEIGSATDPSLLLPDAVDSEVDLDDLALMEALERDQKLDAPGSIDFESTLSAVMAQAERLRSIKDPQKRREEAARIALTLTGEQP